MRNKEKERAGEVAGWLAIFLMIMIVVGILLDGKMSELLDVYLKNQVAQQTGILAEIAQEKLNSEIETLEEMSEYIGKNEDHKEVVVNTFGHSGDGTMVGIMDIMGNAVCGELLSMEEFPAIHESIHGYNAVSYNKDRGLLFAVPVYHGDNIKYVLYKLFDKEILAERFGVTNYGEDGKIAICDREGHLVVPIPNWTEEEHMLFQSEAVAKGLGTVKKEMKVVSSAAELVEYEGKDWFVFIAEIEQSDFMLVGAVSREIMSEGVDYIVTLVLWVFGLLLVLLLIGIIYLLIVEEKARESDELREAKRTAERESRAKSDFLAKMSHEIRTPINAVMGMNEMILRESSEKAIKEYAWNIRRASQNLLSIVNDILDFSKIESGKMELVEKEYSMGALLHDVMNMIWIRAEEKELKFYAEIEESLPDGVLGDETKVQQVITNILNNAVKYTQKGSVFLKVTGCREDDQEIYCISVKDTGIGIREKDKERLFDDFEQLDREKNYGIEGTGLGLAITHRLLDQMGGRLEVESVYGEGSVFTIYLPQKIVDETRIGNLRKRFTDQAESMPQYYESFVAPAVKILVVDDMEVNLLVAKSLLKITEMEVMTCMSGAECLELVQQHCYDIILLDHMMPEMDGIETLRRMKKLENSRCKNTPVIALTANAIVGVRERYLEAGFDDYLSKPVEGKELEDMIRKYLPASKVTVVKHEIFTESVSEKDTERKEVKKTLIDRTMGLEYCGGMEEIYREVLEAYSEEGQESLEKIAEYQKNRDWKNYAVIVHAVKSTSMTIGAKELSDAAKEQEMAAKAGDEEVIEAKWKAVYTAYQEVLEEVKNMLAEEK